MSTLGGFDSPVSVSTRNRVPIVRLSRMRRFLHVVHRPPEMFSPARCTTATKPSNALELIDRLIGSHSISSLPGVAEDRTMPRTSWPLDERKGSSADPMNPDEPVTSIFMTFTAHKKGW